MFPYIEEASVTATKPQDAYTTSIGALVLESWIGLAFMKNHENKTVTINVLAYGLLTRDIHIPYHHLIPIPWCIESK